MKAKCLFLLLSLNILFLNRTLAQSYTATLIKGRIWEITKPHGMGQYSTYSIRLACDTIINSMNYFNVISPINNNILVREDTTNHKIFKFDNVSGIDKLIIDYDINIGSSFNSMVVDSINFVTSFGQTRKVIYFNNYVKWIEGIGSSFNGISDTFDGYTYVTNVVNSDTSCFALSSTDIELSNLNVKQVGSKIYITSSSENPVRINIYNYVGQLLDQKLLRNIIMLDLKTYSAQLILLELSSERKRKTIKVLNY